MPEPGVGQAIHDASRAKTEARTRMAAAIPDFDRYRDQATAAKDRVLADLDFYLDQFEATAKGNGVVVHRAKDAAEARRIIGEIIFRSPETPSLTLPQPELGEGTGLASESPRPSGERGQGVRGEAPSQNQSREFPHPNPPPNRSLGEGTGARKPRVVKGKSMATEEIHLNHFLEELGAEVVETDLGEFVVQLDHDVPSHIVTPIIHKTRHDVSRAFAKAGLGETTTDPETLAGQARAWLREKFQHADIGISGANFLIAESGRIVLVENEGNNRLSTTAPRVHIALAGIEKLIPTDADLPAFLRLLGASATGQRMTVYTHLISGPRRSDEVDGPEEVHVVLLDNGRRAIAQGPYREILRCIRCGACLNVCPVFRQVGGHGYGHVYSGPLGAVLAPLLDQAPDLPFASSLCGACEEVCPVRIPIPDLLLRLRTERAPSPVWKAMAAAAARPFAWRAGISMLPMAPGGAWGPDRESPSREGRDFRAWWGRR